MNTLQSVAVAAITSLTLLAASSAHADKSHQAKTDEVPTLFGEPLIPPELLHSPKSASSPKAKTPTRPRGSMLGAHVELKTIAMERRSSKSPEVSCELTEPDMKLNYAPVLIVKPESHTIDGRTRQVRLSTHRPGPSQR